MPLAEAVRVSQSPKDHLTNWNTAVIDQPAVSGDGKSYTCHDCIDLAAQKGTNVASRNGRWKSHMLPHAVSNIDHLKHGIYLPFRPTSVLGTGPQARLVQ